MKGAVAFRAAEISACHRLPIAQDVLEGDRFGNLGWEHPVGRCKPHRRKTLDQPMHVGHVPPTGEDDEQGCEAEVALVRGTPQRLWLPGSQSRTSESSVATRLFAQSQLRVACMPSSR